METRVLAIDPVSPDPEVVAEAVAVLRQGGVVGLPTETVYGLAGDALRPEAVARIFEAKERPSFDPLIVHLPKREWLHRVSDMSDDMSDDMLAKQLMGAFWPGPLTVVVRRSVAVPDLVVSGLDTVAVRMSDHPVFGAVCRAFGRPLAAPSANRFGRVSPTCGAHVVEELGGRIPLVLDAGNTAHGVESTIVLVRDGKLRVLREGPVTGEMLEEWMNERGGEGSSGSSGADTGVMVPGQMEFHYAPGARVELVGLAEDPVPRTGLRCGLLARDGAERRPGFERVRVLSAEGDLVESAANLFAMLRELDGVDIILAELVEERGVGRAINERLRRAAGRRP